jgi:hypothetical protein
MAVKMYGKFLFDFNVQIMQNNISLLFSLWLGSAVATPSNLDIT